MFGCAPTRLGVVSLRWHLLSSMSGLVRFTHLHLSLSSARTPRGRRGAASLPPPQLSLLAERGTEAADALRFSVGPRGYDCAASLSLSPCISVSAALPCGGSISPPSLSPALRLPSPPPEALSTSSLPGWVCTTLSPCLSLHRLGSCLRLCSCLSHYFHISPPLLLWFPLTRRLFLCLPQYLAVSVS